jgi:transforming growth factor-beta-induced protein
MIIKRNLTFALAAVMGIAILAAPVSTQATSKDWKYNKQTKKCAKFDRKQSRIFNSFNQSNQWQGFSLQSSINRKNDRNCKVTANTVDTLVANGNFKTLTAAVAAAGLVDTLKTGEFTVFAPTDQAFAKLPAGTVEALLADIPKLQSILTYHVVSGTVPADVARKLPSATTVNGKDITIREGRRGTLFINDSKVVIYDIKTTNGIIHVIDSVLLPPADESATLSEPTAPQNNPVTPPTNAPPVTPSNPVNPVNVNPASEPTAPQNNPVTPPTNTPPVNPASPPVSPTQNQSKDIVDTLVHDGRFKTLTAAVAAAGLVDTLKTGEFTVFAPTDQAFAKLPAGTVETLLADIPTLSSILTYHIVNGSVSSSVAKTLPSAVTVNGQEVKISVRDGCLYINDSKVITKDIHTSNGIIHVIDTVLMPTT